MIGTKKNHRMNIYFWNINNSLNSFELAKKTVAQDNQSIFIISEFWEILDQIHRTERNFVHDEINKRVGILCNNSYQVKYFIGKDNFNNLEEYFEDEELTAPNEDLFKEICLKIFQSEEFVRIVKRFSAIGA